MTKLITVILFFLSHFIVYGQSVDDVFSKKKMRKDLAVFKNIRIKANSGLYKYRTKEQIDSIYNWADNEIERITTYREFYNLICKLTDYEGSCHNYTLFPDNLKQNLRKEEFGYFPLPIKWVEGKWLINFGKGEIPLGAEIISINNISIHEIIENLYKYFSTDGFNLTGKRKGIRTSFEIYYRLHYGLTDEFEVEYKRYNSKKTEKLNVKSIGYLSYYNDFYKRHSRPIDQIYYAKLKENQKYNFKRIDTSTGILTILSFDIGENDDDSESLKFFEFLDSVFIIINSQNIKNLVVDVRNNSGGSGLNLLVTYEYLSKRKFSENYNAYVSFRKIPYIKYIKTKVPRFLRPIGVIKYNRFFKEEFPIVKNNKYYEGPLSENHKIREPNKNAFKGEIYLLINPEVASAASNFGSLVASNDNVVIIGEETIGGYYGHNGHYEMGYILPKSKFKIHFSAVNVDQYVLNKPNQIYGRGIIPDYNIPQSYSDFINNKDTQLNFTLNLIKRKE